MRLIPKPQTQTPSGPVVNGAEIAVTLAVFFLIGFGLDTWLEWRPVLTIGFTLFGVVGHFVRTYYAYTAKMTHLESHRSDMARGASR